MPACQRCEGTSSDPQAFLLTCRGCTKTWHHRCLMPPMVDDELIQLIRATTSGDTANGLGSWMCRRCTRGKSGTPSAAMSAGSREPTASSEARQESKSRSSDTRATPNVASTRVRQESSTAVDARLVNDRERSKAEAAPQENLGAQRTKPSQPHVQLQPGPTQSRRSVDVQRAGATPVEFAPKTAPTHSHQIKAARKFVSTVSTSSADEYDVEMQIDSPNFPESTTRATSRASGPPSSRSESVAEPPPHVAADEDDDPDDLYGPPVERKIIRILPSLAEELREQQRRVAAEKEKRRAPLAPDWIFAKHVNDPLWKELPTQGRKRRKPTARKLGENGLNVNELMGCFTVQNWVREHKT